MHPTGSPITGCLFRRIPKAATGNSREQRPTGVDVHCVPVSVAQTVESQGENVRPVLRTVHYLPKHELRLGLYGVRYGDGALLRKRVIPRVRFSLTPKHCRIRPASADWSPVFGSLLPITELYHADSVWTDAECDTPYFLYVMPSICLSFHWSYILNYFSIYSIW
jgi:hypothetical protein